MKPARVLGLSGVVLFAASLALFARPPGTLTADPASHAVLTASEAVLLMPPELVTGPQVSEVEVSSDGRYVLAVSEEMKFTPDVARKMAAMVGPPPPGQLRLTLWSTLTHVAHVVWTADAGVTHVQAIHWLVGSHAALVILQERAPATSPTATAPGVPLARQVLLRVAVAGPTVQTLGETAPGDNDYIELHCSPLKPLAILVRTQSQAVPAGPDGKLAFHMRHADYAVTADGRVGPEIQGPPDSVPAGLGWDSQGSPVFLFGLIRQDPKDAALMRFGLDPAGRLVALSGKPEAGPALPPGIPGPAGIHLDLKSVGGVAGAGDARAVVKMLWLETPDRSPQPRVMVCADSPGGQLLPDGVLYQAEGALWFAPILRLSLATYEQARIAAQKQVAMNSAKQLGLSILMYSQDYNNILPTPDGINNKLEPYLKNDSLFDNFTYTYGGGPMKDMTEPAKTQLGFVSTPWGNAEIYGDGHVGWLPPGQ